MKLGFKMRLFAWISSVYQRPVDKIKTEAHLKKSRDGFNNLKLTRLLDGKKISLHQVEDNQIPVEKGSIGIRIYTPSADKDLPVMVYFHGGGFVKGGLDSHDQVCRRLCEDNATVVVSVDYRMAPEFKFPTALNDCIASVKWVNEEADGRLWDKNRIVLAGDSAGGNLANGVSQSLKEEHPELIKAQVLIYPVTDGQMSFPSIKDFKNAPILNEKAIQWYRNQYLRDHSDRTHPLFSHIHHPDKSGLPPSFILTAEYDPLRDEAEAFAKMMEEDGTRVTLKRYDRQLHGFVNFPRFTMVAEQAFMDIKSFLRPILGR